MTEAVPEEQLGSIERRVIVSASLAHATTHSVELAFAAVLVRVGAEFGVGLAALGAVANAGAFTFGAFALPSGWLTDHYGPRAIMTASMAAAAVLALTVATSPNVVVLAVLLTLLGAAIGLYHPAGISLVATVSSRRGLALASHGIAGNVGIAIAPALAVGVAIAFNWRAAYVAFALIAGVVALVVWRLTPTAAETRLAVAERERIVDAVPHHRRLSSPPSVRTWLTPSLLLVYVAAIGQGFIYRGSLTFLPLHLEEHLELSIFGWDAEAVAGATAAFVLLAAVFGQIAGGTLSDRFAVERSALPFALLTIPFLALMAPSTGAVLIAASAGFVFANWAQQPIINGLVSDYSPPGAVGRAFGISFFLTFGVGSFAGSFAGLVAEQAGTPELFVALAGVGVAILAVLLALASGATKRRAAHQQATEGGIAVGR